MKNNDHIWGQTDETWGSTTVHWTISDPVKDPFRRGGIINSGGGDMFTLNRNTRKKRREDEEEDDPKIIKVVVEARQGRSRVRAQATFVATGLTAELIDREKYKVLILEQESEQQKPLVSIDERPDITAELENK